MFAMVSIITETLESNSSMSEIPINPHDDTEANLDEFFAGHFGTVALNGVVIDRQPEAIVSRWEYQMAALQEVTDALLEDTPVGTQLSAEDLRISEFAVAEEYRKGSAEHHLGDIRDHLIISIGYMQLTPENHAWIPDVSDAELIDKIVRRIRLVADLDTADNNAAYQPHHDGRPTELLDPPSSWYNKYGRLLTKPDFLEKQA